jgi:exopolysaccharide biosynthesis polyprenyl glycosylphosphotransferase
MMQTAARKPIPVSIPPAPHRTQKDGTPPPSVVRGLVGSFSAVADLLVLGFLLVALAVITNGARVDTRLSDLLSMKFSVERIVVLLACVVMWRTILWFSDLYTPQRVRSAKQLTGRLLLATGLCAIVQSAVASSWHHGHFLQSAILFWVAAFLSLTLLRAAIAGICLYVYPPLRKQRSVLIVGVGSRAQAAYRELLLHPEWNYKVVGFVSLHHLAVGEVPGKLLGTVAELEQILMKHVVDEVITVLPMKSQFHAVEQVVQVCERAGVQVQCHADLFETSVTKQIVNDGHGTSRKIILKMVHDDHRHLLKRAIDIVGSLFGLILLAPLFVVVAVLIKCTSKGPVFFRQERYGLNRRTFFIYKFRTMIVDAEAAQAKFEHLNETSGPVFKISRDPRITGIGAILRKTSIDELPQLFNVLKGEMSLVGPRPLNLRDVGRFSELRLMRRFTVKPGLTCIWQVSGRSNVDFDRWIDLDLQYIDNWSLGLDMKLLAKTVPAVVFCRGAV